MRKVLECRSVATPATSLRLMTSLKWLAPISVLAVLAMAGCGGNTNTGGGGGAGDAVATVNGEAVSRAEVLKAAEAQAGEGVLRQVIMQQLVMQEAKKQGITVTDEEVQKELEKQLEASGSEDMKKVMQTPGARLEALKDQIRNEKALNRLITKDVKVDDATLQKWFEKPDIKSRYDKPERVRIGLLLASTKTRADTMATQLKNNSKTFAQLVEEQKKASDPVATQSATEVPQEIPVSGLAQFPKPLADAVKNTKEGQNSGVITMQEGPQSAFAIIRVNKRLPAEKADFAKLKETLEQDYKLEQTARQAMSKQPGMTFETMLKNMEQGMGGGQKPPYRDILNYMVQQSKQDLLTRLQNEAKIDVTDPAYERVAEQFKPTPAASAPGGPGAPSGAPGGAGAPPSGAGAPPAGAPGGAGAPPAGAPR